MDIAARMMETLSLPPPDDGNGGNGDGPPVEYSRHCGVIGGGSLLVGNTNQAAGSAEKGSAAALGGIG